MNANLWSRLTAPLLRRIRLIVTRGVVRLVDPTQLMQQLQVELLKGEVLDGIEHFEPYGFTSHPDAGAEVLSVSLNGRRANTVVIVAADRRYRLKGLAKGEVALHDDQGQKVHLKRAGILIETPKKVDVLAGGNVVVQAGGTALVKSVGKATVEAGGTVEIKGATGAAVKGIVQGDCICAYTGAPHPMVSSNVKGSQ